MPAPYRPRSGGGRTYPDPSPGTLLRVADALGTTLLGLLGGDQERPPGRGEALHHPRLQELGEQQCRALLSTHGVGRVSLTTPRGPAVFPVIYEVVDDAPSRGWSVLVVGVARAVTDPDAIATFEEQAHTKPRAGGRRTLWVSIGVDRLTGRRITADDS